MFPLGSFWYTSSTHILVLLLVVLVFFVFPRAPLFLVCCLWCIPHTCHRLWQGDCTCKQVVNRLKIPQGLSTLLFHRWSEVPSRGGVRGDSPYEKLPALQRCHLSVFSKCCFLELLARPSSVRTLLSGFVVLFSKFVGLSGFVVLFSKFVGLCSSQSYFYRAPFQFDWFILGLFLWPSSI